MGRRAFLMRGQLGQGTHGGSIGIVKIIKAITSLTFPRFLCVLSEGVLASSSLPGSGLCFDWQLIGFSCLGAKVMPSDWIAKSCLFAQIVLGCVCPCVSVCVCVCVCGIFGKNFTWDHRITEAKDPYLPRKEQIPKDAGHPHNSHTAPLPLPHAQLIPNRFWSICVSTKLLVS